MADGPSPLNWRRGLDEIQAANQSTTQAQQNVTQMTNVSTQRYSDSIDRLSSNISRGTQGILDNIRSNEELRMRRDLQRQQMVKNDLDIQREQQTNPLEVQRMHQEIDKNDQSFKEADLENQRKKYESDRTTAANDGSDAALVTGYKGTYPNGGVGDDGTPWTPTEKAAYVKTQMAAATANLSNQKIASDIQTAASDRRLKEVQAYKAMNEVAAAMPASQLNMLHMNPDAAVKIGVDEDTQKKQSEAFAATSAKAAGVQNTEQTVYRILKLGGLKAANPNGVPTSGEISTYLKNMNGGMMGVLNNIAPGPEKIEAESMIVKLVTQMSQEGHFPMRGEWEVDMAKQGIGGAPGTEGFDPHNAVQSLVSVLNKHNQAEGFFNTMLDNAGESRKAVVKDFQNNNYYNSIPLSQRDMALYNLQPSSVTNEGSKDYQSFNDFSRKSVQDKLTSAGGWTNAEKTIPTLVAPDHYVQAQAMHENLVDPIKYSMLQDRVNQNAPAFTFSDPANNAMMQQVMNQRAASMLMYTSPTAVAGPQGGNNSVPATPVGEQQGLKTGNPNTPVVPHVPTNGVPGWKAVAQPNGKAAAGATPVGAPAEAYRQGLKQKFSLQNSWIPDTNSVFKPVGE